MTIMPSYDCYDVLNMSMEWKMSESLGNPNNWKNSLSK